MIGVVKDFNFQSLRDSITPLAIQSSEGVGFTQYVYARVNTDNYQPIIETAEAKWNELIGLTRRPGSQLLLPLKYTFLEDNLSHAYEAEQRAGTMFSVFSSLAIAIACVGLFGLAAYTANLRTKEIGIRKVMGASISSVILLLTKEFTTLISIAFILAVSLKLVPDVELATGFCLPNFNWNRHVPDRGRAGLGYFLGDGKLSIRKGRS